jgi:AMP deaminase
MSANNATPGSPTASMQTNPSSTNPLNHSEYLQSRNAQQGNFQLPGPAAHHHYIPNAHAARISQTPSLVSLPGHAQSKQNRSSSTAAYASPAGGPTLSSISPPDMALMPMSSLDASEPRLFPGIVSKSRKGSMATSRSGLDMGSMADHLPDHMMQSLPTIEVGRPRSVYDDDETSGEDEVGEVS